MIIQKGTTPNRHSPWYTVVGKLQVRGGKGVLDVDDIYFIRHLHISEGWSVRKIARTFHRSRKTIRKYLNRDDTMEVSGYHGGARENPNWANT